LRLLTAFLACCCFAGELEISRPVHAWEFADAIGPRAGLFGNEQGTLEAFVYPLKVFRDFDLIFWSAGHRIPAASIARRIQSTPGAYTIVYSADDFSVRETLSVPRDASGALIRLEIDAKNPLRVDFRFTRDFQLMWPGSFGASYGEWDVSRKVFRFGADGQPFAAILGSPDAAPVSLEYATNYSSNAQTTLTLGTAKGRAERIIAVAASLKSTDEAFSTYKDLTANYRQRMQATDSFYRAYLANTVNLRLPDRNLQTAYDWSRISAVKGLVQNPLLGEGLVAGFGPAKGGYRPGFAWFFGRDSFWTSFALTSSGDLETARKAISFVARFQREDGKIPHEISQATSLVPWFQNFPYGYNAADATPLYISAVRDYVAASGDLAFLREQEPRLWKGLEFMHANLEPAGFLKNVDNGPGWVEGGPLLPVRLEIYQAGCYVDSLRSLAWLARALNEPERAQQLDTEFTQKRAALNQIFWRAQNHAYAFALDPAGNPVDEPSVLATVPMWFELLDGDHAREMIGLLSEESHAADWGMRIISSKSKLFDPSGYHFGSVWPLFTGWASVGEYRYHQAQPAFANLKANADLALAAGGNTTEVLSGDTATPLSTASPHQTWSAAMVISPLLRGLAGLEVDALHNKVRFAPHLPADWHSIGISGKLDFDLHRDRDSLELTVINSGSKAVDIEFAPAFAPCAEISKAALDGAPIAWKAERQPSDWHPEFAFSAHAGTTKLVLKHSKVFGYVLQTTPARLAEPSSNAKVLSEAWSNQNHTLALAISGLAGHSYRLKLIGAEFVTAVQGASREGPDLVVAKMPFAPEGTYVRQTVKIDIR